ncbi:hypothetical protein LWI28_024911 [Acer negundo]|uniref:Bromo domain-containing protein n=1 Tax=Acer negundo TaxID=4023 RepID=A0AAD5NY96_ACENE|nr:hypothetical protein LWI28_024911 [Acer negundo]
MGQIVKRKKKGRPSKADLARRPISPTPETESEIRRSIRRRNVRYDIDYYEDYFDEEDDDDDDEEEKRREKKLKLVLKLNNQSSRDSAEPARSRSRSRSRSSARADRASDDEDDGDDDDEEEDKPLKKRKINDGDVSESEEEEEDNYEEEERGRKMEAKVQGSVPGTPTDHHPSAVPLPDKKSLELILDKLQKKDTYGVYAEPVDPEELPDYHEVIEHPMDFATVRKKLGNESYTTLDQFESDVFLICSNAMQYNASDTVYHKQARTIQELATKKFHRLRVGIERAEKEVKPEKEVKLEKEHKLEKDLKSEQKARSNFLAKKQTKKPFSRTIQEPVGSDFSSGATLATAGDMQNGSVAIHAGGCERPSNNDGLVEGNSSLVDNQDKVEELSSGKGLLSKLGRKPFVLDENRRATYNISNQPVIQSESIFTTFEGEIKQLVAVGLHAEYSYARSLARFSATLGPVAWKVASQRIEQALPPGYKFGRGWVGEYEPLPTPVLMLESCTQKESALFTKLHAISDVRKDDIAFKTPAPVKMNAVGRPISEGNASSFRPVNGPTSEGKTSLFASSAGTKSRTPVSAVNPQQNPFSRTFAEPESKVSKQVELNLPPSASQNNVDLVAGKQFSNKLDSAASRSSEMVSRNMNLLQSLPPMQWTNNGVISGGLPNGKVTSTRGTTGVSSPSSDNVSNPMARAATYFHHVQEQGLTDPVQLMKMLNEKAQKQQNSSNQSSISTPPVMPTVPSARRDDSTNATQAAARAWMSIGAGGVKQVNENSSSPKNQISAESLYNPARELYPQMSRVRGEFPPIGMQQFQSEKNSFPLQGFAPQPVHTVNESQFLNRPMVFPHFVATDLSRFQMQSPWRGLNPHTQPRQKQETLPPDLNISFQSPGSPVKQSSSVLVDSQQPDLALQL